MKKPTKKSCETRRRTKLYFSRDKDCHINFVSKDKPYLINGKWLLDVYSEDRMIHAGDRTDYCLDGKIDLHECELAEVDIAVCIKIYDADGNLRKL